jgi:neutral ceramidase
MSPPFLLRVVVAASFVLPATPLRAAEAPPLRVGAAAAELVADDSMVIGGSILPRFAKGQEGKLRACAVVLHGAEGVKLAIVACDVLMIARDILDAAAAEIEKRCGIPASNVLINCTHTHSAPSTCTVHGYKRDETFTGRVKEAIVSAVEQAEARAFAGPPAEMLFHLGKEETVGQNSRMMLADGTIYWTGLKDDAVRPTDPFDPQLPVLAFRRTGGPLEALLFNHSTHTIGGIKGGVRSPSFYGLAAQQLEAELGGTVVFLEGASGSTHNIAIPGPVATQRIHDAVREAFAQAQPVPASKLGSRKREITVRVRHFDDEKEDAAVRSYCEKRTAASAATTVEVFRAMRRELAPRQGEERKTWVQAMRIGDVAIVGVPAEFFTRLGLEIKRRSPFPHTIIAELANDWIGYVPDTEAYDLGGYQVWTGLHSWVARGTGEYIVDEAVALLNELHHSPP